MQEQPMGMRILVVGAGAVGGYFGGRLAEAGRDVTFLVHSRTAENIRRGGLRIVSPHGDATLHPKLLLANEIAAPYDLILLSVKAYSLESAMNDFAPAVGPGTMILPVLNGMRHIDLLVAKFSEEAVLGGVCFVATEVDQDGRIVQLADMQKLIYGERKGGSSDRIKALDQVMQGAGFDARISENIMQGMWEKWVQLASLGAVTCLLHGNIGEVEAAPDGANIALKILDECSAIASASGYPPREHFLAQARTMLTTRGSSMTSSMYRDMTKGSRVEADQILGDLIERGRTLNVDAPLVEAAFISLSIYQARLPAK
jgi:2-dehydropantoate 2-reductase